LLLGGGRSKSTVDERKLLATWDVKRPCSQWYGVTCDSATHRVTALKLPAVRIVNLDSTDILLALPGPLPAELGSLPELRTLILADNPFSGSLPTQLGLLTRLTKLDVSYKPTLHDPRLGFGTGLQGTISKGLLNSPSLTDLQLGGNTFNLTGISFGPHASSKLKHLNLDQIPGFEASIATVSVPKGLSVLKTLETLSIARNHLPGPVPQFLWTMPSLSVLDFSYNSLSGLEPSTLKVKAVKLKSLDLSYNKLQGSIPQGWSALKSLTGLYLHSNQLTGPIPGWVGALKGLKTVSLRFNQLSGILPGSVFRASLKLNVADNQLSGNIPASGLALVVQLLKTAVKQRSPGSWRLELFRELPHRALLQPLGRISQMPQV